MPMLQFNMTPIIILYFISALITIYLAYRTWQLRPARGALYWSATLCFVTIFILASGIEVILAHPASKWIMIRFIYLGLIGFLICYTLFSLTYSNRVHWIQPYRVGLFLIIPITTFFLILFVDQHQLIYANYQFVEAYNLVLFQVVAYGTFFYIWAIFAYITLFVCAYLLINTVWQSPDVFKGQAAMVILSVFFATGSGTLYMIGINPLDPLDPSPFALTISGILMFFSMQRYKFMQVSPIANDLIFDNVITAIFIVDPNEKIVNMNQKAEQMAQQTRNQMIGENMNSMFLAHSGNNFHQSFSSSYDTEIILDERHYEVKVTPMQSNRNDYVGSILMFYDMSDRLEMERQSLELALERDRIDFFKQFINDASHDFKTPLSILKTSTYLLRRQLKDVASERIDTIETQTERLIRLVDDMLLMVRLEDSDVIKESISINDLLTTVITMQQPTTVIPIQFTPLVNDISLNIERSNMRRAFANIIENAIQYSQPSDEIMIEINIEIEDIHIHIRDTGQGIPVDALPLIFNRFYRGDQARGSEKGTSGLGLAITKRIIERHGGTVTVNSALHIGTEFQVTLPIAP
ncbi:MAG: histidine kinase N-terminal 7TM domain-containing protein [Phototrophicaceae bacterium]